MTVADLFAGIGGFSLGFTHEGYEIAWACEIDRFARRIYCLRFPDVPVYEDIRQLEDVPDADVWCAGFPCQDVSVAGRRKGLSGERTGLFWELMRLVERHRPAWLVLENVPGLLSSNGGADMAEVIRCLSGLGYGVAWRVLDARYFGVAQRRRRVWIVGSLGSLRAGEVLLEPEGMSRDPATMRAERPEVAYALDGCTGGCSGKEQQRTRVARPIRASDGRSGGNTGDERSILIARYMQVRSQSSDAGGGRTTARVPRRVDGPRYRTLGNAVPVPVVAWIARRIKAVVAREAREKGETHANGGD